METAVQYDLFGGSTDLPPATIAQMNRDEKVAYVMERWPECRNDDKELILRYWAVFDGLPEIMGQKAWESFCKAFRKATHPETIRRGRQAVQKLRTDTGALRPSASTAAYRRQRDGAGPPRGRR